MSVITLEVKQVMMGYARGHLPIFLFEKEFNYKMTTHKAAVTLMIRQDDSFYYRCIIDENTTMDVEYLMYGFVKAWTDLDGGMTGLSRRLGEVIEEQNQSLDLHIA